MMTHLIAWLQIAAHLLTFSAVALWYCDKHASYRPGVSLLATVLAGPSLGAALWVMMTGKHAGSLELILIATLAGLVLRAGGNVALLLPPRVTR